MDTNKLEDMASKAGEHFGDYILIVRTPNGIMWKTNDRTWGTGACIRYLNCSSESDKIIEREDA